MATDPHIGTSIRRARERKRWTQRQLAHALGVNIKTVDNWENGRTSPRSAIGAIEQVLGISFDENGTRPRRPSRSTEQVADSIQADLDELRRRLREQDRRWNPPLREQEEDDDDETNGKRRTG